MRKTITYFLAQTYSNKELIIVSDINDGEYENIVQSFSNASIKYYPLNKKGVTQGELRNYSLSKSNGIFFCNWDDDDWHHCRRLEVQISEAFKMKKKGTVLPYCILYDVIRKVGYISAPFIPPGTVLCLKSCLGNKIRYPLINQQEDFDFLKKLFLARVLYPVINPALYIYVYHGSNTTNELFKHQFRDGFPLSEKASDLIRCIVDNHYTPEISSDLLDKCILSEADYFHNYK